MTETRGTPAFAGRPTEHEVVRLLRTFPLTPGTDIPYEALEEVLGLTRQDPHFWSVVHAWRRKIMREQNVDTKALPGQAIRILLAGERLDEAQRDFCFAVRASGRSYRRLKAAPAHELTPAEQQRQDHTARLMAASVFEARRVRRAIAEPAPVQRQVELPWAC